MKKILALVLALMFVLGMTAAFAATYANGQGKIIVKNAVKGETYYAIKALDATVSDAGIAYSEPLPDELKTVFEVKTVTLNGANYQMIDRIEGKTDTEIQAAVRLFANNHESDWSDGVECTGNSVEFTGLDLGYYVIISTVVDPTTNETKYTNKVSAGSTYGGVGVGGATGTVYEKNETTVTVTKTGDEEYSIGDTVTYTVHFNGINYLGTGEDAEIIIYMEVMDTLPEFLSDAVVDSVKIDGTEIISTLDVSKFDDDKSFMIPWADGSHEAGWTSKYANGVDIEITYHATLTDIVKIDGDAGNKNIITIRPWVDHNGPTPREEPWSDHHEIFTHAAALMKVDENEVPVAGAKFQFYGLTVAPETTGGIGTYRVVSYDATAAAAKTEGTEMEVGEDGMLYILGISSDVTLVGTETKAPLGFNPLTSEIEVKPQLLHHEVWSSAGVRYYDENDNLVAQSSTSSHNVTVDKTIDDLDPKAIKVVNKSGAELPHTGGIGTTLFYIGGGILVLAAVILLVTKRRMNAND